METINNKKLKEHYIRKLKLENRFSGTMPEFLLFHYSPGDLLTTIFSGTHYLQFVAEGKLLLYNMPDDSSTVRLQTNDQDVELLGEMELLDTKFAPFFVEAQTDVYTLACRLEQYRAQLLNDPVFLRYVCRNLCRKLAGAVRDAENIPLKEKAMKSLCYAQIGESFGDISGIAERLGVSRRQFQRTLKELTDEGILEHTKKGEYTVVKKPYGRAAK